ncbi:sirohydrochlorin chelatase [Propionibacteriaceae bacterium Y2011]|uniref:sirohydrochlorin chelatase n=1 Tax=Microlunatus sp. Y2014 TaxID=3418488 RepID=UPI003B49DFCC
MSAPVLLLLAQAGTADSPLGSAEAVRDAVQAERPSLDVRLAYVDRSMPSVTQTVKRIVRGNHREVIVTALDLADIPEDPHGATAVAALIKSQFPEVSVVAARTFAPEPSLLRTVDQRLRDALALSRTVELDALVLSTASVGETRSQAHLARLARHWGQHHKLPVVLAAADGSGPSIAAAVRTLRGQGRRHIAAGSWFVTANDQWRAERDTALAAGVHAVAEPLGAVDDVVRLLLARYAFAAMDLLQFVDDAAPGEGVIVADTSGEDVAGDRPRHLSVVGA